VLQRLEERGCEPIQRDHRARAKCPAHGDRRKSLVVTAEEDLVLIHCHAGCGFDAVVSALGLREAEFFRRRHRPVARSAEIEATYDYLATDGTRLQKVRLERKRFAWRTEDASAPGGFRWTLGGRTPCLYREAELRGAARVVFAEGEKAVERLRRFGLTGTCGGLGAAVVREEWADRLYVAGCRDLVILPDNDRPGRRFAERVAESWCRVQRGEPVRVKIVELPGLPVGGDVADFDDAGGSRTDLLACIEAADVWTPHTAAEQRLRRRQKHGKERMRRLREKRRGGLARPSSTGDRVGAALEAILAALDGLAVPSFNAIWRSLKAGPHSRLSVERALARAVELAVLEVSGGEVRGRAKLYRRGPEGVTGSGRSADIHSVTESGHSPEPTQAAPAAGTLEAATSTNESRVSGCPVTPFAVTRCVRTSETWQESIEREALHQSVTENRDTPDPEVLTPDLPAGTCCGRHAGAEWRGQPFQLACKLCEASPTYWRRKPGTSDLKDSRSWTDAAPEGR
jgi:hypothetical protein